MSIWLIISPQDIVMRVETNLQKARQLAKAVHGYTVELEIFEDYRR
jgi:hypothetical protein